MVTESTGNEECDDGDDNSNITQTLVVRHVSCRLAVMASVISSSVKIVMMVTTAMLMVASNCSVLCGDGIVRLDLDGNGDRIEECDDANNQDGDACSPPGAGDGGCKTTTAIGWREVSGGCPLQRPDEPERGFPLVNISTFEMTRLRSRSHMRCVSRGLM